jgi:hypothetical protein
LARRKELRDQVPAEVANYDPSIHGVGVAGIREWKRLALEYLTAHPGELLPVGQVGDQLDVVRQTVQLVREA